MSAQISEVTGEGGVFASFTTSTAMGTDTGDAVWYTGDYAMADQILACAVQQLNIDTSRIITAGCSAGGLQSGAMLYGRSSYLACAMPNSGGTVGNFYMLEDKHVPSLITTHGGSSDMVVISFAMSSATEDMSVAAAAAGSSPPGGYVVDCNLAVATAARPPTTSQRNGSSARTTRSGSRRIPTRAACRRAFRRIARS